jgi:hypothetical protein
MTDKLFTVAGIVTDSKGRTKVKFGNDLVVRTKVAVKNGASRVDYVELSQPSTKVDAIKELMGLREFVSRDDQLVFQEAIESRELRSHRIDVASDRRARGEPCRRGRPRKVVQPSE